MYIGHKVFIKLYFTEEKVTAKQRKPLHEPTTALGKFMTNTFVPKYTNNIMGLVYVGAAVLIIIVGLRGLGTLAGKVSLIPKFLVGVDGKIDPYWVMFALFLEFSMLLLLALVTFFTPSEYIDVYSKTGVKKDSLSGNLREELEGLKNVADEEIRMVESYLEKFESLSKKVSRIQKSNFEAITNMKQTMEN